MNISHSLRNFRCQQCGSLLLKQDMRDGALECKCHSCNTFNTLIVESGQTVRKDKNVYQNIEVTNHDTK
jgi:phage FluMu protein Com